MEMLRLFKDCKTIEEVKKIYKKYAFKYHPDRNGSTEKMQALNEAYEKAFKQVQKNSEVKADEFENAEKMKEYAEKINALVKIMNETGCELEIEICGSWIWIGGNTYPCRNDLKGIGCHWQRKKEKWYIKPDNSKPVRKYKKEITMEEIRNLYGSDKVDMKKKKRKALSC